MFSMSNLQKIYNSVHIPVVFKRLQCQLIRKAGQGTEPHHQSLKRTSALNNIFQKIASIRVYMHAISNQYKLQKKISHVEQNNQHHSFSLSLTLLFYSNYDRIYHFHATSQISQLKVNINFSTASTAINYTLQLKQVVSYAVL